MESYRLEAQPPAGASPPPPADYSPYARPRTPHKSPFVAGLLSVIPGLGQAYVGYYRQAFLHIAVFASVVAILDSGPGALEPLFGFFAAFFFFFNLVDAVRRASLYNQVLDGVARVELPKDFEMPGVRGSLAAGGALIGIGLLLFLHTRFGVSMAWLAEWWPLAVIGFGVYLVVRSDWFQTRRARALGEGQP